MYRCFRSARARYCLIGWLMLSPAGRAQPAEPAPFIPMVLTLKLNGVDLGPVLLLRAGDGVFYFGEDSLDQWQVCRDGQHSATYQGRRYHPFGGAPPQATYDATHQTLDIMLAAKCFSPTDISLRHHASKLTPTAPGFFVNYDAYASGAHDGTDDQHNLSAELETVGFSRLGSLQLDLLAPSIGGNGAAQAPDSPDSLVRLDTTFTHDDAENMTRWEVGDAIGGSGIWGRPVRFAGIQFARNFDTHPGFVTQPLPSIAGEAELPSTVEVYLNGVLATRQQVQPGPFQIDEVPSFGTGGDVQLVVKDLLGREMITNLPFVTGASLLKQGLSDFSLETGILRENYGIQSFDYRTPFATATGRFGVTDELTVEGRSEMRDGRYTAGIGSSFVVPFVDYVVTAAVAGSHSPLGGGEQETLSLQPGVPERVGLTASLQFNSDRFIQLGTAPGESPPRYLGTVSLSIPLGKGSGISLSQVRNATRGTPGDVVDSLSANHSFGRLGSISVSAFAATSGSRNRGVLLAFSLSLRPNDSLVSTANIERAPGASTTQWLSEFDHLTSSELGWGWDVRAGHAEVDSGSSVGAGFTYQGSMLSASGQLDGNSDSAHYQFDLSGGAGLLARRWFATRQIFDSFGLARVADVPGLPVYVENQLAGYTDAQGRVLLPRLIAFSENKVSIDANDLPFDAELVGGDSVTVAPYARSGVLVDLPVRRFKSALVTLRQADGSPVPAGALVSQGNAAPDTFVAGRGEVYLRDVVEHGNRLQVTWEDHRCRAQFDLPQGARIQPHIGPLACLEDAR